MAPVGVAVWIIQWADRNVHPHACCERLPEQQVGSSHCACLVLQIHSTTAGNKMAASN